MRATPDIWLAGLACWAVCALLLRRLTSWRNAVVIALVKAALPVAYFVWFYDGLWTVIDDIAYWREGSYLLARGYNPITVFTSREGFQNLLFVSNGLQFLYGWFNLATQWAMGQYYWAPVLVNVLLTVVAARSLMALLLRCGTPAPYARRVALLLVVHWDVLAWSSFLNVKDILVMTLTLVLMRQLVALADRPAWKPALVAALTAFVIFWVRFYVPLVAVLATVLYQLKDPRRRAFIAPVAAIVGVGLVAVVGLFVPDLLRRVHLSAPDLLFGWVRTLVSPLPWSVQRDYYFLQAASVLQVATFPLLLYGAYRLVRMPGPHRLLFIYGALLLLAVAAQPELQGPRHRVQILWLVAWCQYHGAYTLLRAYGRRRAPMAVPA